MAERPPRNAQEQQRRWKEQLRKHRDETEKVASDVERMADKKPRQAAQKAQKKASQVARGEQMARQALNDPNDREEERLAKSILENQERIIAQLKRVEQLHAQDHNNRSQTQGDSMWSDNYEWEGTGGY